MAKVGRPKGSTKPKTVSYHRRIRPEFVKILDKVLDDLKNGYVQTLKKFN